MSLLYDSDADPALILAKKVAVVGFGNQGEAHALNLRDSGVDVVVGARSGKGFDRAVRFEFPTAEIRAAVADAELVVLTVPDEAMAAVFREEVMPFMRPDAHLGFAHGFAVTYGTVSPPNGAVLVSPSGPGTSVRSLYLEGSGIRGFVASDPPELEPLALSYAWALRMTRAGVIRTTFREETECDLFGEQVVLCGGMPELAVAAFETLVEAGYAPEVAYTECVQQVRLLADLMAGAGVAGMKKKISDTAEWGSYLTGSRIVDGRVRETMRRVLADIVSGRFANDWIAEADSGKKQLDDHRKAAGRRLHEQVWARLSERGERG